MAVFRVEKTKDFTIMCNHHLRNRKLSLKAKGLLSLMLSLPEDWDYTTKGLAHICKDGIDAISTALKELEQQGYLTRERVRLPSGRLGDIEYTIHEQPVTLDIPPNSPKRENPRQVNPGQAFPEQVKPERENHAQLNTNRPKTENNAESLLRILILIVFLNATFISHENAAANIKYQPLHHHSYPHISVSPGLVVMRLYSSVFFGNLFTKGTSALPIFMRPCPASALVM